MTTLKNKYAIDFYTGLLVTIDQSTDTGTYKCVLCGEELIRKMGNGGKVSHFSHSSGVTHDGESVLHKLGKLVIKERFNREGAKLQLKFYRYLKCRDFDKCKIHHNEDFKELSYSEEFDLKDGGRVIVEEKPIYFKKGSSRVEFEPFDGCTELIPDLFIYHPDKPLSDGIMVEICYTHPCSQDKIDSGIKIIEIHIKNEVDLDRYKTETIVEEEEPWDRRKKRNVILYNFNTDRVRSSEQLTKDVFSRFIYYKSGSCRTPQLHEPFFCDKRMVKFDPKSLLELNIVCNSVSNYPGPLKCGLAYLKNKGRDIRNCLLCKYYHGYDEGLDRPCCALSKKYKTPLWPQQYSAIECNYYKIKENILTFVERNKDLYIEEVTAKS